MDKYVIKVQLMGGSRYIEEVELNHKEIMLFRNKDNINACWEMLCQSIEDRLGMRIIGNISLVSYTINGEEFPLH